MVSYRFHFSNKEPHMILNTVIFGKNKHKAALMVVAVSAFLILAVSGHNNF